MKLTLKHWLPTLALLVTSALSPLAGAAEKAAAERLEADAAQAAVDQAANAAEEAADKAVESLNRETKLDLDFTLDNPQIEKVAAR